MGNIKSCCRCSCCECGGDAKPPTNANIALGQMMAAGRDIGSDEVGKTTMIMRCLHILSKCVVVSKNVCIVCGSRGRKQILFIPIKHIFA